MLLVDADQPEPMRSGARELAVFLTPEPGAEAKEMEETIEGMLLRVEEFCSLTDMIRNDTSQILEENIPVLKAKVTEMRGVYARVDQLEAFVRMVGRHVTFLEAHVLQAERDHGAFPQALRRWLGTAGLPSFRNVSIPTRPGRWGAPSSSLDTELGETSGKQECKGHIALPQMRNGQSGLRRVAGWLGCGGLAPSWASGLALRRELWYWRVRHYAPTACPLWVL
ncbi:Breast carcinoma-amplified sequence 4 [Tupaia chinensis]|uniref:Breast carcinoma-amplified sequence 4 n=1 Tax=Tupaia chinensis TaxID=246437 RepID=L9LAK3_TUPCH|nr:Breast carcinoma-amplified sequence 4 [Tupaia chinensis]